MVSCISTWILKNVELFSCRAFLCGAFSRFQSIILFITCHLRLHNRFYWLALKVPTDNTSYCPVFYVNTNIALNIHKVATPQILFKSGTAILGMSLPGLLPTGVQCKNSIQKTTFYPYMLVIRCLVNCFLFILFY